MTSSIHGREPGGGIVPSRVRDNDSLAPVSVSTIGVKILEGGGGQGGEGLVDKLAAEGPVPALDHHWQRDRVTGGDAFLDQVAIERGQVQVGVAVRGDGDLVVGVVGAYQSAWMAADTASIIWETPSASGSGPEIVTLHKYGMTLQRTQHRRARQGEAEGNREGQSTNISRHARWTLVSQTTRFM